MTSRRRFLRTVTLGAAAASVAEAEQPVLDSSPRTAGQKPRDVLRPLRIGVLEGGDAASNAARLAALRRGLADVGYVEGHNLVIEYRTADGRTERLSELARELVRLKVDAIVTSGTPAALSAKQATATTPIVMASSGEPVAEGVVASLSRPGGNVTGLSIVVPAGLGGERLRLLTQVAPAVSRVGVLWNPGNIYVEPLVREASRVATATGVTLKILEIGQMRFNLEQAFEEALLDRVDALITMEDYVTLRYRHQIVEFAAMSRLPAIYGLSEFVEAGGLVAYGADRQDMFRRAAGYVHKILAGARPGDLPVEPPTKFELAINLKTARALGVTIPAAVLSRADRILE